MTTIAVFAAILALPISGASAQSVAQLDATAGRCLTDDEVPASERAPYETAAKRFVETVLGERPENAYAEFTEELRERISAEDFSRAVVQLIHGFRPLTELHVAHSYRESQARLGSGRVNVPCTALAHGSLSAPDGRVMIAASPAPLQAHVIIEGKAKNNRWAFVLWLFPDQPNWRIGGFYMTPITILDRTATDLWNLAREQKRRGHSLNSYLLYVSAAQLAFRGPNLQLGIQPEIVKEVSAGKTPPELEGKPPYDWKFGEATYHVLSVGPTGTAGVFDLEITYEVAQAETDEELERRNRALITAFAKAHSDYAEVFDGLVVRAKTSDGTGFTTIEQKHSGK
ncbi:MAG TPA: hypothetical protein VET85_02890 [Stellaceae bacterium]|nr:hypothetical protein [Stellaceae bacterium]